MEHKSMLSDAQIAKLLGIELNGGLQDIPAFFRIVKFRENFESALEELLSKEVENAKRNEILLAIGEVSHRSIDDALKEYFSGKKRYLKARPYGFLRVSIIEQRDKCLRIAANVLMYTGEGYANRSVYNLVSRDDAVYIKDVFNSLKTIKLDSIDGVCLERVDYPRITSLTQPVKLPSGDLLPSTHLVEATYTLQIPEAMLPLIYSKYKQITEIRKPKVIPMF